MTFLTYILHSSTRDRYYIGHSGDNLDQRVRKHNSNHHGFTGRTGDWQIVYLEKFDTKEEAYKREKELKGWKSKSRIEQLVRASEHSAAGGRVGGSNPSTPTLAE